MKTFKNYIEESADMDKHINDYLSHANRYETGAGKEVYGGTLSHIHDHVKSKGFNISKRALEDHMDNNRKYKQEQGYSRMGWTRKGQNKKTHAVFYHNNTPYVPED